MVTGMIDVTSLLLMSDLIPTPLGDMLAVAGDEGIVLLDFKTRDNFDGEVRRLKGRLAIRGRSATVAPGSHPHLQLLRAELADYFAGERHDFTVPVVPHGTEFELRAWSFLQTIPHGQTRSYGQQAAALGTPNAARAVGRANGANFIGIIIPCHRVIGAGGSLTGYGGGIDRKRWLLDHEKKAAGKQRRVRPMPYPSLVSSSVRKNGNQ
jgi:AraC family transcriptional regulator of adaptative response/methylated-DNA-[protein]-cysteine methyltransferase